MQTPYGYIKKANSKYIILAPHGVSEFNTIEISDLMSDNLNCSAILNTNIHRDQCNFNNIADLTNNSLKQQFYSDLDSLLPKENSLILYIHGMCDRKDIVIDLGLGVRWNKEVKAYTSAAQHPRNLGNKGVPTANIRAAINLRKYLHKQLQEENKGKAKIGARYAAWNQYTANQYFANSPHQAIQIEIGEKLRTEPQYIADLLSAALLTCYQKSSQQSSASTQYHHTS
tara:strand:- start:67670 stop:68353 length:684 start_codon:yes stop_codon:yes gene_type:complete